MPRTLTLTRVEYNGGHVRRQIAPPPSDPPPPPPPPPIDRSTLIPGTYKPSASTTGVPTGVTLTRRDGNLTISTPGTTYTEIDFYGKVSVTTTDVSLIRCRVRGDQTDTTRTAQDSSTALVQCTNVAVRRLLIEDCDLSPTFPSNTQNGILGHDFTVRRSNFNRCSDGIGCYNAADHGPSNVLIEANWIHDLWYVQPSDTGGRPEGTHNDCMQLSGGTGYRVVGNWLECLIDPASQLATNPHYPYLTGTGCVTVTPVVTGTGSTDASGTPMADILIDRNWMDGGGSEINISQGPTGTELADNPIIDIKITDNQFGRNRRPDQGDVASGVIGYVTAASRAHATYAYTGNTWEDGGGAPLPIIANG